MCCGQIDFDKVQEYNFFINLKKEENGMKKTLAILLAFLLLTMAACGQNNTQGERPEQTNTQTHVQNESAGETSEITDRKSVV